MRFNGLVLVAAFAALSACGGGDKAGSDTGAAATPPAGTTTGAAAGGAATGTAAAVPVTGTVHEVKMLGDEKGYRFDPVDLKIKAGDGVKWVFVSGGPHNVAFQNVSASARAKLSANMPNQISDLSSPMMLNAGESYQVSFAGVAPGKYDYICTPHLANNMKGSVTVQ